MKRAIVTINYNKARFLQKQLELFRKFMPVEFDFIVGDNSTIGVESEGMRRMCVDAGVQYVKLDHSNEYNPSVHHAKAINTIISRMPKCDQVLLVDHDVFPFKPIRIFDDYQHYDFAGVKQIRGDVVYLAPCLLLINNFSAHKKEMNMLPVPGLDTGGSMSELLLKSKVKYISEMEATEELNEIDYSILDGNFMHFVKGSGWDNNPNHKERIEWLFNELNLKVNS